MTNVFDPSVRPRSKGPKVLFILGGIAVVVGGIMMTIGAVLFGTNMFEAFADVANARDNLELEVEVPGSGEVYLEPDTYKVVAIGDGLVRPEGSEDSEDTDRSGLERAEFREPVVTVTTSEGTPLKLKKARSNATISVTNYDLVAISSFKVTTPGTYNIEVNGEPGPVTAIGVGQASELDDAALVRALGGGVLFGVGILLVVFGIFFLIGGGVWLAIDRSNQGNQAPGGPPSGSPLAGWTPPVVPPYLPPAGHRPVKTDTYPPSFDPPGPQTPSPPPLPPPPWEPPQSPIS